MREKTRDAQDHFTVDNIFLFKIQNLLCVFFLQKYEGENSYMSSTSAILNRIRDPKIPNVNVQPRKWITLKLQAASFVILDSFRFAW